MRPISSTIAAAALAWLGASGAGAEEIVRHRIPGSDFPIAQAIEVPAGLATIYLSGFGPTVADAAAAPNTIAAFGDTRAQTASTLAAIDAALKGLGLTMGDVVKMTVFLAGDPVKGGRMDFAGMMAAYREHYGTAAQPNLPTPLDRAGRGPRQSGLARRDRGHRNPPAPALTGDVWPPMTGRVASARAARHDPRSSAG